MFAVADVLVAGGGIAGLLSALELRDRGLTVTLLDASGDRPPASWAGGGILSPLPPWQYSSAMHVLCRDAYPDYRHWQARIERAGGPDPQLTMTGMLVLEAQPEIAQAWACAHHVPVHTGAAGQWLPWLMETPAVFLHEVASIRNPRLLKGLQLLLKAQGVTLIKDRVEQLDVTPSGVTVRCRDSVRQADQVLITAGAWSQPLLPALAMRAYPAKGQMLLLRSAETMPESMPVLLGPDGYLVPRADGLLLAGSTVEPEQWDGRPTAAAGERLLSMAASLWPALEKATVLAQWSGLRPALQRELPLIGVVPESHGRVWLNTGHYRNGLVSGPASARLVAQLICAETPFCDPAPYSVSSLSSSSP